MDTTSTTPDYLAYIDVLYMPGITVYGTLSGRLMLTKQGRLVLTTVEGTKEAPIYKEVMNVATGQIKKFRVTLDQVSIKTDDKVYRMSVAPYTVPMIATGGVAGGVAAYALYARSGAPSFIQTLRSQGIPVIYTGFAKIFGLTLLILAGIFVVFILSFLIFGDWL